VIFVEYEWTYEVTCAELEDYFYMNDNTSEEDVCVDESWGDCTYLKSRFIDGVTSCEYYEAYDWCEETSVCEIVATVDGVLYEETCDDFVNMFNLPANDCLEWAYYDCMDEVPADFAEDVLECQVSELYDYCIEAEDVCFVEVNYLGEYMVDTCDNIDELFFVTPEEPEDCAGEEQGDCMTLFTEHEAHGLESCYYWAEWDYCDTTLEPYDECWAEISINGTVHEGDCDDLEDHFGTPNKTDPKDNCTQWGEPMDCMADFGDLVPGLEACEYWEVFDCNGVEQCKVRGVVNGTEIAGPCDDILDMFFGGEGDFNGT